MGTTMEQTDALADVATTNGRKIDPVMLRSAHDYTLVEQSLTHRVDELKKLEKKNNEEGYVREARVIAADIAAIEQAILPQVRNQRTLDLSPDQLEKELKGALQPMVYEAFSGLDDPKAKVTPEGIRSRRNQLVKLLVERIAAYATDVSAHSFDNGYQVRVTTFESLAMSQITTLRGGRAD